jgi:hypothetical protein
MAKSTKKPAASESSVCVHPKLDVDFVSNHFGDTNIHFLQVKIGCADCGRRMKFIAEPVGPTTEPDQCGISFPFVGEDEEPTIMPGPALVDAANLD